MTPAVVAPWGGEDEMKPGDRVWQRVRFDGLDGDSYAMYSHRDESLSSALPDSPALPAVARFLAEHPDAASDLRYVVNLADGLFEHKVLPSPERFASVRSLVAALAGAEGASDGG